LCIITFNFLKIILLRYSFAPLLIFELAMGTLVAVDEEYKSQFAGETKFFSLPNGILLDFEQGFQVMLLKFLL